VFHGLNTGCQYTVLEFGQIRACWICVHGTAEGAAGWCNSNYIIGRPGQLGGGTSGPAGATYGIRLETGAGNTGELNYWIVRDVGYEGLENGLWCSSVRYSFFDGARWEINAVTNKIFLREDNSAGQMCYHNVIANTALYDFYFVSGGRGIGTQFTGPMFTAGSSGGTAGEFTFGSGNKMIGFSGDETAAQTTDTVIDTIVWGGFNTTNYLERYAGWVRRIMGGLAVSAGIPLELGQAFPTSAYTVANNVQSVFANGTFTVTLPAASSWLRRKIKIYNIGSGAITVSTVVGGLTIAAGASATVEAATVSGVSSWYK
jgi:hypothetical protein